LHPPGYRTTCRAKRGAADAARLSSCHRQS
jgi:hypothetical protein